MAPDLQRLVDTFYLALVVWREARGEGQDSMAAVAWSIVNRVLNPKWWGASVQTVITKKWQYSSMTDPHDAQLTTWPSDTDPTWALSLDLAQRVLNGSIRNPVAGADSYYDTSIPPPNWADPQKFVAQIGRIRFYNLDGDHPQNKEMHT